MPRLNPEEIELARKRRKKVKGLLTDFAGELGGLIFELLILFLIIMILVTACLLNPYAAGALTVPVIIVFLAMSF